VLKLILKVASLANVAGGLVLIFTWAAMWQRVPVIVVLIGASLLIQGAYSLLYLEGQLNRWADLATGALFAGEGLAACVGAGGLIEGIIHNINNNDMEMAPVLAGFLMLLQALLVLGYLIFTDRLRPGVDGRSSA
jgi:ABC-type transport system involved in multi-copper enzyme maturation permease subunit